MLSPETVVAAPLCAPPDGRGSGWGPDGASLAAPTPPPLRESSHTWMELHLIPHTGSLLQPDRDKDKMVNGHAFILCFHLLLTTQSTSYTEGVTWLPTYKSGITHHFLTNVPCDVSLLSHSHTLAHWWKREQFWVQFLARRVLDMHTLGIIHSTSPFTITEVILKSQDPKKL